MRHYTVKVIYRYEFEVELDAENDEQARDMSIGMVDPNDSPTNTVWEDSEIVAWTEYLKRGWE
jgi:hypothetical protein